MTPLDWKNQIERRWYPGDRAVITLYEGPAFRQRIVDEVTYSEWDIINRSPDNVLDAAAHGRPSLNIQYPTLWPPNTMGVDFYKSLERKHPFYHGDTVGRTNRWQATDGAYDDWAPNMGAYTRIEDTPGNFVPVHWFNLGVDNAVRRYGHAMSGSPLRPNITQRLIEQREYEAEGVDHPNMPHLATSDNWGEGFDPETYTRMVETPEDLWWAFDRSVMQSKAYTGPGDLMGLPYFAMTRRNVPGDPNTPALNLPFGGSRADGALVGQKYTDDLPAITNNFAPDSIQLTAAQAEFEPVLPTAADILDDPDLAEWLATELPQAWRPVHLFELLDDLDDEVQHDEPFTPFYLFQPPPADALPEGPLIRDGELDLPRWPLENRRVMFVSGNLEGFEADPYAEDDRETIAAAEAFLHWGAEDGLVNGEYDVYMAVAEDLDPVRRADLELRAWSVDQGLGEESLLTPEGHAFMETEAATEQVDIALDAQLFTDQQGDLVNPSAANRGNGFGELRGLRPDSDGLVRLGTVRIENNYLGLHLRNWTPRNRLARFSRVILTPAHRTAGPININTARTERAPGHGTGAIRLDNNLQNLFNVMEGIPGLLTEPFSPLTAAAARQGAPAIEPSSEWIVQSETEGALPRALRIGHNAPEWPDGRYYRYPSELISVADSGLFPGEEELYRPVLSVFEDDGSLELSDRDNRARRFDEMAYRFSRMGNLISTRSDVFEITVTAQIGYVEDPHVPGNNYRTSFVPEAERRVRMVYER